MLKKTAKIASYTVLLILLGFHGKISISLIMVFIHEMTHYLVARMLGYGKGRIEYIFIGLVLVMDGLKDTTQKEDFIISAAGPVMNIVLAGLFFLLQLKYPNNEMFNMLVFSNLTLGIFNLIPAFPLDGGRMLRAGLSCKYSYKTSREITYMVSMILGILFMLFYFMVIFSGQKNVTIGLITLFIIFSTYQEKKRTAFLIMGDIVRKKVRFVKRGYIEGRTICIHEDNDLLQVASHIDKYRFSTFLVLNSDMQVVDMFYEDELIKGLKDHGNIPLGEFLKTL